jgi:phytoene dehydrogenase-like protein
VTVRRAVVIGAGHHGLLCAGTLAGAGWDVVVLEAAERAGGAVRSEAGPLDGFVIDPCSAFFPLTRASPAFADVELPGVEWIDPPLAMAQQLSDGRVVVLSRELERTVESLERAAPGAGRAWSELVDPLLRQRELVLRTALARLPPPAVLPLALSLGRGGIELARLMAGSAASLGRGALGGDAAAAWLAGSAVHTDLAPDEPGSAAFGLFLNLLAHMVGWPFPRGGAGAITRALVERLERGGGELRLGCAVEAIECGAGGHGRVSAVRLATGERVDADVVVATVGVAPLLRLLPPGAFPERLTRELRRWRYGLGTFKVDYALSAPVPWQQADLRAAGAIHVGDTLAAQVEAARAAARDELPRRPSLVVGQHSLHDPTRAPAGRHTLYVYTHVPPGLGEDAVVEAIEARIEEQAPGFRGTVLARTARTPERLERENPSLVGGAIGAGSAALDQQLIFRPAPELCRYRTPVRGLYVAGAATHPGPGVHGVSGAGAAKAVLSDQRKELLRLRRKPRP